MISVIFNPDREQEKERQGSQSRCLWVERSLGFYGFLATFAPRCMLYIASQVAASCQFDGCGRRVGMSQNAVRPQLNCQKQHGSVQPIYRHAVCAPVWPLSFSSAALTLHWISLSVVICLHRQPCVTFMLQRWSQSTCTGKVRAWHIQTHTQTHKLSSKAIAHVGGT